VWAAIASQDRERDYKTRKKIGFAFVAVLPQSRLHHRRPVERRYVVDVVRSAVPLEVRLDCFLVELAIVLLRWTTG
jgi:hypothetical protein